MTRGRRPLLDSTIGVEIRFPKTLLAQLSLALMDPITGQRRKGAMSELMVGLARRWVAEQTHGGEAAAQHSQGIEPIRDK